MITKNIRLYLGDGFPVRIPVSQYDTMWQFVFTIIHNSQPWQIPTGATAVLNGKKPDGNVFAFAGTINGNTVTVDADVQMTAVAGQTVCELSILSDGKVVGTANFILDVEAAPKAPEDVSSKSTLPVYEEMMDQLAHTATVLLPDRIKEALLACFQNVVWINGDETYRVQLEHALYDSEVVSIVADFDQGTTVIYDVDQLDALKQYLTVTANYDDGTSATVTTYTLSGELTAGTSTITAEYNGKTATFTVNVTEAPFTVGYTTVGNPTIDDQHRMTATQTDFIKTPFTFDNNGLPWELRGKVNVTHTNQPSYLDIQQNGLYYDIVTMVDDSNNPTRGVLVELNNSKGYEYLFNLFASSVTGSWDIVTPAKESFKILDLYDADMYFKVGWTGSAYYIAASADGVTWDNAYYHEWTSKTTNVMTGYAFAFGPRRGSNKLWGYCIYVDSLELDIDGDLYWRAV